MVSSIHTYIVIHRHIIDMHICILRDINYHIVKFFKLGYLVFSNADVVFYFQYVFKMEQVRQQVNGEHILVV